MINLRSQKSSFLLIPGAVLMLIFIAFGRSLIQGFAPIDDSFLIVRNLAIRGITWENLKTIFSTFDPELYIPLTLLSFQLNYVVSALSPWSYHLANLLLHAANALLMSTILLQFDIKKPFAILGGLLFAMHPLHTEAVVWIAGRKDLLSTFFYLLSVLLYIEHRRGMLHAIAGSLLCAAFALLSKAMAITLPAVFILIDFLIDRRHIDRSMIMEKIPFIVLSLLFIVIALFGKERVIGSSGLSDTLLMAGKSTVFYLEKILLPIHLSVYYPHRGAISLADPEFFVPLVILLGLLAGAAWTWKRSPWFSFGILFFLITLAPTFGNFHKGAAMFFAVDRYAYLPSVGILFLLMKALSLWGIGKERIIRASGTLIVIVGVFFSIRQTKLWDAPEALFAHALTLYPESISARTDLARIYRESGQEEKAFDVLKAGLAYGDNLYLRLGAGLVYAQVGQVAEAKEQFEKAREMDPMNPEPEYALGSLEEQMGNRDAAKEHFVKAVELDPSFVAARVKLGRILALESKVSEARLQFQEALRWNQSSFEAHAALGILLAEAGDLEGAEKHLRTALELKPQDPEILRELDDMKKN